MRNNTKISWTGFEGALMVLVPLPFLYLDRTEIWQVATSTIFAITCLVSAFTLVKKPVTSKILIYLTSIGFYTNALPYISKNPFVALSATVILIGVFFILNDFHYHPNPTDARKQRAWWSNAILPMVIITYLLNEKPESLISSIAMITSLATNFVLYLSWTIEKKSKLKILIIVTGFFSIVISYLFAGVLGIARLALFFSIATLATFPKNGSQKRKTYWWDIFFNRPARILLITFLGLCVIGTITSIHPRKSNKSS